MNTIQIYRHPYIVVTDNDGNPVKQVCTQCGYLKNNVEFPKNKYGHNSECLECHRKRYYRQRAKNREYQSEYNRCNRAKRNAKNFIYTARKHGLTSESCALCGDKNTEFHHPNYEIRNFGYWLCRSCHLRIHRNEKFRSCHT